MCIVNQTYVNKLLWRNIKLKLAVSTKQERPQTYSY